MYGQTQGNPVELNGHRDLGRAPADAGPTPWRFPRTCEAARRGDRAARGIGEAIAKWLIMAGAEVVVVDQDTTRWRAPSPPSPAGSCPETSATTASPNWPRWRSDGPIELVVNNVKVTTRQGVLDVEPSELGQVLVTNLQGPWLFHRPAGEGPDRRAAAARPPAPAPGPPARSCSSSSLHDRFVAENADYGVGKAGVAMLAKTMAKQLAPHGIRVNAISPGWIRTAEDTTTPEQVAEYAPPATPGSPSGRPACSPTSRGGAVPAQRRLVGLHHRPEHRRGRRAVAAQLAGRSNQASFRARGSAAGAGQQAAGAALADLVALLLEQGDGPVQLVLGLAAAAAEQQHLGQVDVGLGPRVELVGLAGQVDGLPGQPLGVGARPGGRWRWPGWTAT